MDGDLLLGDLVLGAMVARPIQLMGIKRMDLMDQPIQLTEIQRMVLGVMVVMAASLVRLTALRPIVTSKKFFEKNKNRLVRKYC